MTDKQSQSKFFSLDSTQQKQVRREATVIKQSGANHFWIETGCYANSPKSEWVLMAFAMMSLNLISSTEFYGV